MGEVATIPQEKQSLITTMATKAGMDPKAFEQTVRTTVMPAKHTNEQFGALMLVANEYGLNPIVKEIYAFPARGGGIVPIVSIDGWVNLVNSHPKADGFTFEWEHDSDKKLVSCTCKMHRKDRNYPVEVTEYLTECKRSTDPWKMEHRMLRHKAMIQAARYAFGFSGIYDEDEGAKIAEMKDVSATDQELTPPPPPSVIQHEEESQPINNKIIQSPDDILEDAETWFNNSKTGEDVEKAWEEFQHHLDGFEPADKDLFNALYDTALQRVEPNTLVAG